MGAAHRRAPTLPPGPRRLWPDHVRRLRSRISPTGRWTPESIAEAFAKAGVKKMFTRALDARWGVPEAIARQLDGSELAEELRRIGDLETIAPFVSRVGEECRARGIDFRNAFEFRLPESNPGFGSPDTGR